MSKKYPRLKKYFSPEKKWLQKHYQSIFQNIVQKIVSKNLGKKVKNKNKQHIVIKNKEGKYIVIEKRRQADPKQIKLFSEIQEKE